MNKDAFNLATEGLSSSSDGVKYYTQVLADVNTNEFELELDQDVRQNDILEFQLLSMSTNWRTEPFVLTNEVKIYYEILIQPVWFALGSMWQYPQYGSSEYFTNNSFIKQFVYEYNDKRTGSFTIPKGTNFSSQLQGMYAIASLFKRSAPTDIMSNYLGENKSMYEIIESINLQPVWYTHGIPVDTPVPYDNQWMRFPPNDFLTPTIVPVAYEGQLGFKTSEFVPIAANVLWTTTVATSHETDYTGFSEYQKRAAERSPISIIGGIYINVVLNMANDNVTQLIKWNIPPYPYKEYLVDEVQNNSDSANIVARLLGLPIDILCDGSLSDLSLNGRVMCSEVETTLKRMVATDNSSYDGWKYQYLEIWPLHWQFDGIRLAEPFADGYYFISKPPNGIIGAKCTSRKMHAQDTDLLIYRFLGAVISSYLTEEEFLKATAETIGFTVPKPIYDSKWRNADDRTCHRYYTLASDDSPSTMSIYQAYISQRHKYSNLNTIRTVFGPFFQPDYYIGTKAIKVKAKTYNDLEMSLLGRSVYNGEDSDVVQVIQLTDQSVMGSYQYASTPMTSIENVLWVGNSVFFNENNVRTGTVVFYNTSQSIGASQCGNYSATNFIPVSFNMQTNGQQTTMYFTPKVDHTRRLKFFLTDEKDQPINDIWALGYETPRAIINFSIKLFPNLNSMLYPTAPRQFPNYVRGPSAYSGSQAILRRAIKRRHKKRKK